MSRPDREKKAKKPKSPDIVENAELTSTSPLPQAEEAETTTPSSPSKKRKRTTEPTTTTSTKSTNAPELEVNINAPEPPSKKDLRKLKKLKDKGIDVEALQRANVNLVGESNKGANADEKKADVKHSQYGVWIGNLSFTTTRENVFAFFTGAPVTNTVTGEVGVGDAHGANATTVDDKRKLIVMKEEENVAVEGESATGIQTKDITRIHLPKSARNPKWNKGFAYVDFRTASSIPPAVALSEKLLLGRKVLIKASTDFQGRPEVKKEEADVGKNPPNRSIFVGNLGFETTEDELMEHFSKAGKVKKVRMTTFEDTGKCKGFGWVDFEDLESAKFALNGKPIDTKDEPEPESEDGDKKSRKRKKGSDKKQLKIQKFGFMGSRKLRLEYGEDATTRYNKRHKKPAAQDGDAAMMDGDGGDSAPTREWKERPLRLERKVDARTITPGAALAKAMEQRLTGRIVEGKGKKITFE